MKRNMTDPSPDMTPMIDVVFQLLIFFLVTLKPQDVIGRLDAFRPQRDDIPPMVRNDPIRLTISKDNRFMFEQRWMTLQGVEKNLAKAMKRDSGLMLLVQCSELSDHGSLVQLLDVCAKVGARNISVATLPTS